MATTTTTTTVRSLIIVDEDDPDLRLALELSARESSAKQRAKLVKRAKRRRRQRSTTTLMMMTMMTTTTMMSNHAVHRARARKSLIFDNSWPPIKSRAQVRQNESARTFQLVLAAGDVWRRIVSTNAEYVDTRRHCGDNGLVPVAGADGRHKVGQAVLRVSPVAARLESTAPTAGCGIKAHK
jgi:hypothetical protein